MTHLLIELGGVFAGGAIIGGVGLGAYHRLDADRHLPLWVDMVAAAVVLTCAAAAGHYVSPDLREVGQRVALAVAVIGALMGPSVFPALRSRMLRAIETAKPPAP